LINPKEKYFHIHYNNKPTVFALKAVSGKDYFIDENGQLWKNEFFREDSWGVNDRIY
jgi:hypothetical protein